MKDKNILISSLILLLILAFPAIGFAQTFQSNCIVTKVGNPLSALILPPECTAGEIPSADRATLLNQINNFVSQGKITFAHANDRAGMTNGTGQVRRKDGAIVNIDTQVLRSYVYMVNKGFSFTVSSMIGTHAKLSSSGNVSRHWEGHAYDVSVINGRDIDSGRASAKPATVDFMKTLAAMPSDLSPRQIICSGNGIIDPEILALEKGVGNKVIPGHTNHVHVGY